MTVITGATGHLGNVLVRQLVKLGKRVRAVVLPGEDCSVFLDLDIEIVRGDVRDLASLIRAFKGADRVYHLASLISITPGERDLLDDINVRGTENVLEACRQNRVRRLIYTSSVHAFAPLAPDTIMQEDDPIDPLLALGDYGKTKARATLSVLAANDKELQTIVVHPAAIIGPFDYRPSKLGQMMIRVVKGKFPVQPQGAYNFVDVRDVVQGEILAGEKGVPGQNYILSGETHTLGDFFERVCASAGRTWSAIRIPQRLVEWAARVSEWLSRATHKEPLFTPEALEILRTNTLMSHDKASRVLGYKPRPLDETIRDEVHWFKLLHAL